MFEVITTLLLNSSVLEDCILSKAIIHFGRFRILLRSSLGSSDLIIVQNAVLGLLDLEDETLRSYTTSVSIYLLPRRNIAEDLNLFTVQV
jgi:hypothetical protein